MGKKWVILAQKIKISKSATQIFFLHSQVVTYPKMIQIGATRGCDGLTNWVRIGSVQTVFAKKNKGQGVWVWKKKLNYIHHIPQNFSFPKRYNFLHRRLQVKCYGRYCERRVFCYSGQMRLIRAWIWGPS